MAPPPPPPPPVRDDDRADVDTAGVGTVAPGGVSWWRIGALGATALAGCAYVALYDPNSSSSLYPACPFLAVTGLDCPGCGITRALHALVTGNPLQALDHNALFVLALPFLLFWAVRSLLFGTQPRNRAPTWRWTPTMTWAAVTLVGGFWVIRNLPWSPFDWLASGLL
nr:DUF2752 domain-containing protein [Rhabdothermincola salaria]